MDGTATGRTAIKRRGAVALHSLPLLAISWCDLRLSERPGSEPSAATEVAVGCDVLMSTLHVQSGSRPYQVALVDDTTQTLNKLMFLSW